MMNFYKNLCGRKGFTLIELVAVTAMLLTLLKGVFGGQPDNVLNKIRKVLEIHKGDWTKLSTYRSMVPMLLSSNCATTVSTLSMLVKLSGSLVVTSKV